MRSTREEHLFRAWLRPTTEPLAHSKSLFFVRGNHELRGPFARRLLDYVPTPEGRFYYARDAGPVHLIVLDTGEDKPDDTNVYAELNLTVPYRAEELAWFQDHVKTEATGLRGSVPNHPHARPSMGLAWPMDLQPGSRPRTMLE